MKRRILFLLTALILAVMLAGCGNPVKTEEELVADLNSSSQVFMVEGSHVAELSIIKRLTDEDNLTDQVYVSILIDHPNATESRAYVMNYTLYNDGWMLDDVEDYYGDEAVWKVTHKGAPSSEHVMSELITWSNVQIDAAYSNQYFSGELTHTYFFEDGKYATTICTGSFDSDNVYSCIVDTERVFSYAEVNETQLLHFEFDNHTYTWKLYSGETIFSSVRWHIAGIWSADDLGVRLVFDESESMYNAYTMHCNRAMENYHVGTSVSLDTSCPSSHEIISTYSSLSDEINLDIEITPDRIFCYDRLNDRFYIAEPDELVSTPCSLDVTGIIDMSIDENALPYYEFAKEVISITLLEPNKARLKELWHPEANLDVLAEMSENFIGKFNVTTAVHVMTSVETADNAAFQSEFEMLRQQGCNASEIATTVVYMFVELNGEIIIDDFYFTFAQEGDTIYVVDFP